jgi:hypothetical protein
MGQLELRTIGGRLVHYLDGKAVENGARVEVLLSGRRWIVGIYQWAGTKARWAGLRFELGGPWDGDPEIKRPPAGVMALHPDAILRWPAAADGPTQHA